MRAKVSAIAVRKGQIITQQIWGVQYRCTNPCNPNEQDTMVNENKVFSLPLGEFLFENRFVVISR
jgi:hypothetical protein